MLLKEYFTAKLGRLGLARAANEFMGHLAAMPGQLVAPEVLKADNASQSSVVDSFSYGVLMYEIFRNEILDDSDESRGKLEEQALKTTFGKDSDRNLQKQGALIIQMTNANPQKRFTVEKALGYLAKIT